MQKMKKVLACILTLCMLIGMPLSLNVAATGDPNTTPTPQTARLAQALLIPDSWDSDLPSNRSVQLYFNCTVTANPAPVAYIALVDSRGLCYVVDPATGTLNTGSTVTIWDADFDASGAVILRSPQDQIRNYHPNCDTLSEILALAEKTGLTPVVRLRESGETIDHEGEVIQYPNNTVYGMNVGSTGQGMLSTPNGVDAGGCASNGQVRLNVDPAENGYDYIDVTITTVDQAPSLKYVETNGSMIRPIFSEAMYWDGRSADANPTHLRVVNSKGQIMYTDGISYEWVKTSGYYAIGDYNNTEDTLGLYHNTFFTSGSPTSVHSLNAIPYNGATRDWTSVYNHCVEECNALNQSRFNGETYSVALVIEENANALSNNGNEFAGNYRLDSMWTADMVPLMATHTDESGDRVVVPLCTSAQIEREAASDPDLLTLKSVSISSTPGLPDHVIVEFSKPVATLGYNFAGIRLYEASGWVPTIDGSSAQWPVSKWEKYNTSGTQWIGEVETRYAINTFSQIEEWLIGKGRASRTGDTLTMLNGNRLEFAFVARYGAANDRFVTEMHATDGTPLFANDSPFLNAGEDRAYVSHNKFNRFQSVNIEQVTVYADKYVLIDFDQDVTWNRSLFYNGLCVYDREKSTLTATNGTDYAPLGTSGYNTNLQKAFTSWEYYGNRKDIVVATLPDGAYSDLAQHLTKANAISPERYALSIRLEDYTENRPNAIDGITHLGGGMSHLYTSSSAKRSILYSIATHHSEDVANAQLTQVRLIASNKAILSFSTAVTAVDMDHIHLVSGNQTYPITSAEVDGNYVTVTFNEMELHDGMGIRIDGGADYRLPASVVTTENGAVVFANETANSAYLTADITEAVANVKLNDTYYIDLSTVWANQKAGDTITLYNDADMTDSIMMVLSANVTLDLNGHTLTVPYFFSFGHVIDQTGEGLLAMTADGVYSSASLQTDNRQLPLYDKKSGGYRFFDYDVENVGTKQTQTSSGIITTIVYGIRVHFDNKEAYTLLQDVENADVTLSMDLTLQFPNKDSTKLKYTFTKGLLAEFASVFPGNAKKVITLTVKGLQKIATEAMSQPSALVIDTHSTLRADCGVEHDSTDERIYIGITPAQAAVNWINNRIANHDLVSFNYNGSAAVLSGWSPSATADNPAAGRVETETGWKQTLTYTKDNVVLSLDILFNEEHASLEWVGHWKNNNSSYSKRIANIRILNAAFPIQGATMTTARQGGQNYIYDYQPYSIDLTGTTTHKLANTGGRSSQGAWPYFDLTSNQNTYGIMGAIGWTGDWSCEFTYNAADKTVNVSAGMQTTDYRMEGKEELRTPSMVIQFFKGTQDDGHNDWRQLILDEYTPDNVHTYGENNTPCAPISINTWGGWGEKKMLDELNKAANSGQYFEYQWIDAGWYGDYISYNGEKHQLADMTKPDDIWHTQRGSWYYNPGFTTSDANKGVGGFAALNEWHAQYQADTGRDTGLIVWFEPGVAVPTSVMAKNGTTTLWWGGYENPITGKTWKNDWFFSGYSEIDYGIPEALDYVKAFVLHYLDDMDADIYRQDFNSSMTKCWTKKDSDKSSYSYPRYGVAEIQYVMGHYDLLDTVLSQGYQIDNCASGGRLLDIEMMKRSIPLWRTDYTGMGNSVASGIRSQGANLSWWLPISGGMGSAEGLTTEYTFRSTMATGITMGALENATFANKMLKELRDNREMMLGDYYILQQGLHESLKWDKCSFHGVECWIENDPTKDYTNSTNAAYEYYLEDEGKGYVVAFRPTYSDDARDTVQLKGLDRHADYLVVDADTGETATYTGRYLMEQGLELRFPDIRTSRMIYFTKQS